MGIPVGSRLKYDRLSVRLVIDAKAKGLVRGVGWNEADTRSKLIDPKLHARGWTEDLIKREETAETAFVQPKRKLLDNCDL